MQHYQDQKPVLASIPITELLSPGKNSVIPSVLNQFGENRVDKVSTNFLSPSPSRLIRKKGHSLKESNDKKFLPLNELDSVKKTLRFENHITIAGIQGLYSPQRSKQTTNKDKDHFGEKPSILKLR